MVRSGVTAITHCLRTFSMLWFVVTGYCTDFSNTIIPLLVLLKRPTQSSPMLIEFCLEKPLPVLILHSLMISPISRVLVPSRLVSWVVRPSHTSNSPRSVNFVSHPHTLILSPHKGGPIFEAGSKSCVDFHPASSTGHA